MRSRLVILILFASAKMIAQNPGDAIFFSGQVHEINIEFTQDNWWDSLQYYKAFRDATGITTYMEADLTFNGMLISNCGIRLKGNSSYGYPGQKKPVKIKFNEYVNGQALNGLKKINLNNNALDPSFIREKLFLDFLFEQGLPAPRCTFARLSYNGEYVGLYKIIEQVDKVFLDNRFGNNDGNLFKGDPAGSLIWMGPQQSQYYPWYDLKTNETENDWSDLVNFIDIVNNTPEPFFQSALETVFHPGMFVRSWAANNLFVNLDHYFNNAHNYYLYHDEVTDRFRWIDWDVSVVFGFFPFMTEAETTGLNLLYLFDPPEQRPLTARILMEDFYRALYLNAICEYVHEDFLPELLFPKIDSLADKIRPFVYAEPDSNQMFPEPMFEGNLNTQTINTPFGDIPALKSFIANRRNAALAQLNFLGWSCFTATHEQSEDLHFSIFPNPASEMFQIGWTGPQDQPMWVRIFDTVGRLNLQLDVLSGKGKKINLNGLKPGVYIVEIVDYTGKRRAEKLIVSR